MHLPRFSRAALVALIAATGIALPTAALAQQAAPAKPSAAQQKKLQSLVTEYRSTAAKLDKIRKQAVKANPKLAKQRDQFQSLVEKRMAKNGFDAEAKADHIKDLRDTLQSKDSSDKAKKEAAKEFRKERVAMQAAQEKTLQEPKVKKAGEKLRNDTLVAMRRQDSDTDKLLDRLQTLQQKLQSMMPAAKGQAG